MLTGEEGLDLPYSFEAMAEAGSMLGSGSIIVFDETTSVVDLALRTARFYHHESCGKCTPCREGTNWTVKMLERVVSGEATPIDLDVISSVQENIIGNCLCVLGDSMAAPVASMVKKFRGEFEAALEHPPGRLGRRSRLGAAARAGLLRAAGGGERRMSARRSRNAVTLVVDGREVVAPEGTMLVDAAKQGDIEIPVFCYEPKLGEPVGACRMCLVEIEGMPKLQTACSTPVRDGMVVYTQTEQVHEAQNAVVEFLLVNHPLDCPVCDKGGECPLQDISMGWGPGRSRFTDQKRHFPKPVELSPLVAIDRERCILCYRCVRFSQEVAEDEQLQLLERGDRSFVGTFDDRPYVAPFHGNITELCPVGALTNYTYRFRARPWDIEDAGSICTLCPSQCNIKLTVRDEGVARVLARDNHDVDDGWLCDKGRYGFQMLRSEERITEPMARAGDGSLSPISWEAAMEKIAAGLKAAGAKAAALVEGGASNEEGWLLQKIIRGALGSAQRRLLAGARSTPASAARAGAPRADREDGRASTTPRRSSSLGCDPLNEAPILDLRIRKAVRREGAKLAVATERPTALDGGAEHAVRYAPGEAGAFLDALAGALGADGLRGRPATTPVEALAADLKGVADPVIVWGERLWRSPGRGRGAARLRPRARDRRAPRPGPARDPRVGERPRPARGRLPGRPSADAQIRSGLESGDSTR